MKVIYSDNYEVDLGVHVFPTKKYKYILNNLLEKGIITREDIIEPQMPSREDLLRVHTEDYIKKLEEFTLSIEEVMVMEVPYTAEMKVASWKAVGGTMAATEIALQEGLGVHIGGGFHHSFPDHGEGFCVLNDVAVAIKVGLDKRWFIRPCIVDLDLHQGNGNAFIFRTDERVFTFSMHQYNNYPMVKPPSRIDINLPDGVGDEEYNGILIEQLDKIYKEHKPDIIYYIAGADPYEKDLLGGLCLTKGGLEERDRIVIRTAYDNGTKLIILLGGGYASDFRDTVDIHTKTIEVAWKVWQRY